MAKFGDFVGQGDVEISSAEMEAFREKFNKLLAPYWGKYEFELKVVKGGIRGNTLYFYYTPRKLYKQFRNIRKDRVRFDGLCFGVSKAVGYLDNFDWCEMKPKDPTKPEKNYADAPEFQWSVNLYLEGSEIKYRHRQDCVLWVRNTIEWGTEFDDIDFRDGIRELFEVVLCPILK